MAGKDLGPLDWRVPIVDSSGKPTDEFQRRWSTSRGNFSQMPQLDGPNTFSDPPVIIDGGNGDVPGALPTNGTPFLWVLGADGTHTGRILLDGWGGHAGYSGRRANGTRAAPSGVIAGDSLTFFNAFGWGATGYSPFGRSTIEFLSEENWTDVAQGTGINFRTTPNGTTTDLRAMYLSAAGRLGLGTSPGSPSTVLDINNNAVVGPAILTGSNLRLFSADATASRMEFVTCASSSQVAFRRSEGTGALPTATGGGQIIGSLTGFGFDSAWVTGSRANLALNSMSLWTPANHETSVSITTTPNGTITPLVRWVFASDGSFQMGSAANIAAWAGVPVIDKDLSFRTPASTITKAGLNMPHGAAPSAPVNGDVWTTSAGIFVRINGVTVGPLSTGGGGGGGQHEYEGFGALPLAATFTGVNVSGDTLTDSTISLVLDAPANASNPLRPYVKTAPATPYDVYGRIEGLYGGGHGGICVRNSANGKLCLMTQFGLNLGMFTFTNANTFNSTIASIAHGGIMPRWLRINNDGTTLTGYYSSDGISWTVLASQLLATFVGTADQIGIYCCTPTTPPDGVVRCSSFGTVLPT